MKVYRCDSCKRVVDAPYVVRMKEFCVDTTTDIFGNFRCFKAKKKVKIHLCERCFEGLHKIALEQEG